MITQPTILIVDDEPSIRESLRMLLKGDYRCVLAPNAKEGLVLFEQEAPDLVMLDILMPGMDGIGLLEEIKAIEPDAMVIMVTAVKSIRQVVETMQKGAEDYICKPFDINEVALVVAKALEKTKLRREVRRLRKEVQERFGLGNLVGKSKLMRSLYDVVERVTSKRASVLLLGESGTGKELLARAIHYTGRRANNPFVAVNCAALPENLMESELFGHERGAFTDASQAKPGQFELADTGTVFLDEVGELSLSAQTKLLRFLQEREFRRLGGSKTTRVDVRVISATNQDIEKRVAEGRFRSDLYYRINVVTLVLPPLRDRPEDIPLLLEHFLDKYAEQDLHPTLSNSAMEALGHHSWPGNVRELENTVERMLALSSDGQIGAEQLPPSVLQGGLESRCRHDVISGEVSLEQGVEAFEKDMIHTALERANWVQTRTADLLGVSRRILKYKMDKYGITQERANR